jgi:hypothetical protein
MTVRQLDDGNQVMDDANMKFCLLMESAQAHQKLAESHLDKLRAHTRDLDSVVRDEIRRTLVEELQTLTTESRRAAEVLGRIRRNIGLRVALSSVAVAVLCTGIPVAIARWFLPSESDVAGLRARRDELTASIAALERKGGRIEWRRCGATARLCVRVDRSAPAYGEKADYYVVMGY